MELPQILKLELHMIQQSHTWEYIQRKLNQYVEEIFVPYVHSSIIYNSQDMETTKVFTDR